jgi:predicted esterase
MGAFFICLLCFMTQQEIVFSFKARYFKIGEINPQTRHIWFVLHGYGQLAQYFIKKFSSLERANICVIAPEGLSRFYLENLEGGARKNNRVGATWMTRENRLMDIENYLSFLDSVYDKEVGSSNIPVTILGFSQGSATATRWAFNQHVNFNRLILWAGIFPPDMDFETGREILKNKEVFLVYGKKDPFLNDSRFAEMNQLSAKLQANVKEISFDGEHEIDEATLLRFS